MYLLNHRVSGEPVVEERKDQANGRRNAVHNAIEVVHERIFLNLKCTKVVPEKRCPNNVECVALEETWKFNTGSQQAKWGEANLNEFTESKDSTFSDALE